MLKPMQVSIVSKAIIIRFDAEEGTVNEIIAANYPSMTEEDELLIKAAIVAKRPEIDVNA